jgi:MFS family permease
VRFLQEARGREYEAAVTLADAIPLGWIIGCLLLGSISDRLDRRKPVIFGGTIMLLGVVAWVLFGNAQVLRGHAVGILMEIASGAAMLRYSVINRPVIHENSSESLTDPNSHIVRRKSHMRRSPLHVTLLA